MREALSTGEFERWCAIDAQFKERMDDHIANQIKINAENQTDIALLKASRPKETQKNTIISAVVAGVTSGLVGIFK